MRFSPNPWLVAALAFVVLGFSRGLHSSFGVFNVALLDSFNWSRGATAGIFSVVLTIDAMLSPVADIFAASIFGFAGITSSFGRVVFGFTADRLSRQAAYTLNIAMTLIGVGALMILREPSQSWLLYLYVIFFGIGFGSLAVIFSALTADIFSGKGFGSILVTRQWRLVLAVCWAPDWAVFITTGTGSYLVSFGLSALVLSLSDICIRLAAVPSVANYDKRTLERESNDGVTHPFSGEPETLFAECIGRIVLSSAAKHASAERALRFNLEGAVRSCYFECPILWMPACAKV